MIFLGWLEGFAPESLKRAPIFAAIFALHPEAADLGHSVGLTGCFTKSGPERI